MIIIIISADYFIPICWDHSSKHGNCSYLRLFTVDKSLNIAGAAIGIYLNLVFSLLKSVKLHRHFRIYTLLKNIHFVCFCGGFGLRVSLMLWIHGSQHAEYYNWWWTFLFNYFHFPAACLNQKLFEAGHPARSSKHHRREEWGLMRAAKSEETHTEFMDIFLLTDPIFG